jgi:recombination protein RecT
MNQPHNAMNALRAAATGQQQRTPYEGLKHQLEISKQEFYPLLGHSHENVSKFVRVVLNAALANPELIHADRKTFIASCMKAAQDGLLPDGREAVLNIYTTKVNRPGGGSDYVKAVQYLPMVAGYIKMLYSHPDVLMVDAAAVYANDKFTFQRGDEPKLVHEPTMSGEPGEVICAYVVVRLKGGEIKREVMPRRDIEKVRGASKAGTGENSPWTKWYDQQAIKSVIKRAAKQLPRTNQFEDMDRYDNEAVGLAGTPETLSSIIGGGAPALEHNPSETLDMSHSFGNEQNDHVERGQQDQQEHHPQSAPAARKSRAKPAPAPAPTDAPAAQPPAMQAPATTYAMLADRIQKCDDRELGLLILDEGRALPPEQQADLGKVFDAQFPQE